MNLTGQNIRHINTITHDSKLLVFGTAADGNVYYSIKRSGFEDNALKDGADPFGFEDWKKLRLGDATPDASVTSRELKTLTDTSGNQLLRSGEIHRKGAIERAMDRKVAVHCTQNCPIRVWEGVVLPL